MKLIPNSTLKQEMLNEIGLKDIDDLFSDIPKEIRINDLELASALSQQETEQKLRKIAENNKPCSKLVCFLGGGIKYHYVPAVVKAIISRSEFYTSYTPYQPEASQGFLQAMFEYQSMISEITGMDVANASLYDGATALAEAALMCVRIKKKNIFVIPRSISVEKKSVLDNYLKGSGCKIKEVDYNRETGKIDIDKLKKAVDENVAGIYIENPNFFGVFEDDVYEISEIAKNFNALFVVGVDPLSLGIVKSPGEYNADIVVGEGRCLGNSMDYGGSSLGILACKRDYIRQMPGRLIGLTRDSEGKRAFCMTLQTREQHIRREKATSNICTNEGLNALAALVYLSWLGRDGFEKLAKINFEKAEKLSEEISSIDGFKKRFSATHFNEFVIKCRKNVNSIYSSLLERGILCGPILDERYPELKNCIIFGVTEMNSEEDMDKLISVLREVG